MKNIFLLFLIFSINSFSQGFISNDSFYEDGDFIQLTRSAKPVKKSLTNYVGWTHFQLGSTCVSHSISSGMTILYNLREKSKNKDRNNLKSFSNYFPHLNIRSNLNEGFGLRKGLNNAKNNGHPLITYVEYDKFFPFAENELSSLTKMSNYSIEKAKENATKFKLKKWKSISTIKGIKQSISQNYPVLYGINYVPPSFDKLINCKTQDCYWNPDPKEKLIPESRAIGHAMLIVGYDDDKQAVLVLNSWGKNFGNNGYFWIRYEDVFTGRIPHFDDEIGSCTLDIGFGYCFGNTKDNNNKYVKYSMSDMPRYKKLAEEKWDVDIPDGNGFGSEAFSLQGIAFDEAMFWEEKQYIPQSQRKGSKASILEKNPDFKDSDWFMKFDDLLKDSE
jgi:hypothetical protein